MNSLMQKELSHHKTRNINKEWRNGGTDRLLQAEHTFCLTALTIEACVACVNKKGPGSLVILKLDLELIATESTFAPNNYLSDPNQHIKSVPKSTRRKILNLPEHFQLICIISKGLLVCVFWNAKEAQLKISVMK